jgi:KTSC domain
VRLCKSDGMRTVERRADQTYVFDSSVIGAMTYSDHATLDLVFRNGTTYRYFAVPAGVVEGLRTARSAGAYFHRHIRPRFRTQRLA